MSHIAVLQKHSILVHQHKIWNVIYLDVYKNVQQYSLSSIYNVAYRPIGLKHHIVMYQYKNRKKKNLIQKQENNICLPTYLSIYQSISLSLPSLSPIRLHRNDDRPSPAPPSPFPLAPICHLSLTFLSPPLSLSHTQHYTPPHLLFFKYKRKYLHNKKNLHIPGAKKFNVASQHVAYRHITWNIDS